ncbi:Co2+/Mg2+ efflux protein ApaG [Chelativorans sp.]|uniref:Co2+/Mg2+ efflux protein ApaG n=1 Tax=Chelativorans sp. TaxID=2203393 RepID=UPI0028121916|nr:Co2+/Mg2+ efflux protein ApaG [Chelativorans sp.]
MYRAVTHGIEVCVEPFFLPERSDPDESRYFWAYQVTIANRSSTTVKLLSRYWRITDAMGRVEEVRGDGVVGEQPELEPGGTFRYTSGCPLGTSSGIMVGHYTMRTAEGGMLEVKIPAFSLDFPGDEVSLN